MAELLEESQMQELSKVFRTFDLQTKGTLDTRELGACFRCFGYVATGERDARPHTWWLHYGGIAVLDNKSCT